MKPTAAPYAAPPLAQPPFDQLQEFAGLLRGEAWPTCEVLSAELGRRLQAIGETPKRFVPQDQQLLRDGLHFEARIAEADAIATRAASWHDLFGALAWLQYPRTKLALNHLQVQDLSEGSRQRTRRQQSLTHVDEAGLIVASSDERLLAAIDAHDWERLFWHERTAWGTRIEAHVLGHALFELMRQPHLTLAGKAVLVQVDSAHFALPRPARVARLDATVAAALRGGRAGADPKDMPSVPLSGVPGWRQGNDSLYFIRTAPCFRPRPPQRVYATALRAEGNDDQAAGAS